MRMLAVFDLEITSKGKIADYGAIKIDNSRLHTTDKTEFEKFIKDCAFLCGHNIFEHDMKFIENTIDKLDLDDNQFVDTLHYSPLLFPKSEYHRLVKDYKLNVNELNNPMLESRITMELLNDEVDTFNNLDDDLKLIYYTLLHNQREFKGFFNYVEYKPNLSNVKELIFDRFGNLICTNSNMDYYIDNNPIELAYSLAIINTECTDSITPPWVTKKYPTVNLVMNALRSKPCDDGCKYCDDNLNIYKALNQYFNYDSFREYDGIPLQENAVRSAVNGESLIAVFPTGGGKSLTFQTPALMAGVNSKALTVVISPLQSLMKDQIDNLEDKNIAKAVTLNGQLDPIQRKEAMSRIYDGKASILYIAPESLRSLSIEKALSGRNIARFVIDEAHCFSSWGHDFRVDYLYIGDFIKKIQETSNNINKIPVSCFTATAKVEVIDDIKEYFKEKLDIEFNVFSASSSRKNLSYKTILCDYENKYQKLREKLEEKDCPSIVYVSRTKLASELAEKLTNDGFQALPYHGKMERNDRIDNQEAFKNGKVNIIVGTSAFGMGIDKDDVGLVVHYEIADSIENYVQEAGRAGRNPESSGECYILYNEEDLDKHFALLNNSKLTKAEIGKIWQAVKNNTSKKTTFTKSPIEIADDAGWNEGLSNIETRVTTAISQLEKIDYIKRGHNVPRVFADSLKVTTLQEAVEKILKLDELTDEEKGYANTIVVSLFNSKDINSTNDIYGESRVDYLSLGLGVDIKQVIRIINVLKERDILSDGKDLVAHIPSKVAFKKVSEKLTDYEKLINILLGHLEEEKTLLNIKKLNSEVMEQLPRLTAKDIKMFMNFLEIKGFISREILTRNNMKIKREYDDITFIKKFQKIKDISSFIANYLVDKNSDREFYEFSIHEVKQKYEEQLIKMDCSISDIEDALLYLSRVRAMDLEGGFLVIYQKVTIERLNQNNREQYNNEHYNQLKDYYQRKIEQIHIVGEFAKKLSRNEKEAMEFVNDYFTLKYKEFLRKYLSKERIAEIRTGITPERYKKITSDLSDKQLGIINDKKSKYIAVAAGPGSGKTRVLVHKLASLLLLEETKPEQLLMLTFSRAAANEFRKKLTDLLGKSAYVDIKTFHSYCFDLQGKYGYIDKTELEGHSNEQVIIDAVKMIDEDMIETSKITKAVLVIDEAQDINTNEYALINKLIEKNEDMRVILVGDDDQNIYEFRKSSSKYLYDFIKTREATKYELVDNYRSRSNLIDFSNEFLKNLENRIKTETIRAVNEKIGNITINKFTSYNFSVPLVDNIIANTKLDEVICVLTDTNQKAAEVLGMLKMKGIDAQLIQIDNKFKLKDMIEVKYLLEALNKDNKSSKIQEERWNIVIKALNDRYKNSPNIKTINNLISDYENTYDKHKYISDLEMLIEESRIEDYIDVEGSQVVISTIHKSKGLEFDHVYLLLEDFKPNTEEKLRQLYVAITRAKNNLSIYYNGNIFDSIKLPSIKSFENNDDYPPALEMVIQITYEDSFLSCYKNVIEKMPKEQRVQPGDVLKHRGDKFFIDKYGNNVFAFSNAFYENEFSKHIQRGYKVESATVKYVMHMFNINDKTMELRLFPEIHLKRSA